MSSRSRRTNAPIWCHRSASVARPMVTSCSRCSSLSETEDFPACGQERELHGEEDFGDAGELLSERLAHGVAAGQQHLGFGVGSAIHPTRPNNSAHPSPT